MQLKQEITETDVKEMGLKCGLEIHQQLEGRKLFSRTPTLLRDDEPDFIIKRFLRASAGESGEVDKAAAAEQKKQKYYVYQAYKDTTGLVELDEEPPAPPSKKAIEAALQVATLLDMHLIDQIRFMRKTVVNGSNTSGFQRTGLVAVNGLLETESGAVGVESLCLEEDSAKDVNKESDHTVYNLSRLGIPLIEIATGPHIYTPEQAKEVAEHLGMVLRSIDNVKRGLGTIRQDVNVSIATGVRVEIKGAQDLKLIPDLIKNEMLRQHNLLLIFEELKKREASVGTLDNVTDIIKKSESKVVQRGLEGDGVALAIALRGFKGLLGQQIQAGRRFGTELSDYAKVMGVKGLFHSDELPNYGITQEEKNLIIRKLNLGEQDAFILIIERKDIAVRAMEAVIDRLSDLTLRKEVRVARPDGGTSFMRPMPGAARMYPETDIDPILIDKSSIVTPKLLSERIEDLSKQLSLAPEVAKRLIRDGVDLISLSENYDEVKPSFIIDLLYSLPSVIKKNHDLDVDMQQFLEILLEKLQNQDITKESLEEIVVKLAQGKPIDWNTYKPLDIGDLEEEIRSMIKPIKDKPMGAIMGQVMGAYKGKIDGKELSALVLKIVKELN
ncbi:MAG: Glu-tRNA(Gln) amidotransferase subunit GatE [Nanoarchaeota archaeon]|nr:Glu-tRNA(Gln) amidotransferase subunit GatE [Nanoarchaeota archaeon]